MAALEDWIQAAPESLIADVLWMPLNLFLGRTEKQLLVDLQYQQDNLAANKSITMNGVGETRKAETINKSIEATIAQILRALNALNPAKYPANQTTRDSRTRASFKPESFSPDVLP